MNNSLYKDKKLSTNLCYPNGEGISVLRALKHIKTVLELMPETIANSEEHNSAYFAAMDDLDLMISKVE